MVAIFCIDVCGFWFAMDFVVCMFFSEVEWMYPLCNTKQMVNEQCREGKQTLQDKLFYELSGKHVLKKWQMIQNGHIAIRRVNGKQTH